MTATTDLDYIGTHRAVPKVDEQPAPKHRRSGPVSLGCGDPYCGGCFPVLNEDRRIVYYCRDTPTPAPEGSGLGGGHDV